MSMSDAPRTIRVRPGGREYDIVVQAGLLRHVGPRLRQLSRSARAVMVSDDRVGPLHGDLLATSLHQAGFQTIRVELPPGEEHKTVQSLWRIYDTVLAAGIERDTPLLALGGGVIGDMAGFAAATLLRGIPLVQIPTTLLAMVDASIGGKTGVNHPVGKNLIGAFHQPIAVFIDPLTLGTLPPRELRGGLAECIKHQVIRDAEGFADMERHIERALAVDVDYLSALVAQNVAIKAAVVEADPFEQGQRAHLNFGHTFGHAIETVSRYAWSHGECVALGMVAASRLAVRLGMLDEASCRRIVSLIRAAGLPVSGMSLDVDAVVAAMAFDKKVRSARLRFVLPLRIGEVCIRDDVPLELVRDAVAGLR